MITSRQNPKVQWVRSLQAARPQERRQAQAFVVEGVRLVEEAAAAGWKTELVFYTSDLDLRGKKLLNEFAVRGAPVEEVRPDVLKILSDTETPQGILAVLSMQRLPLPPTLDFILIVDEVRDPGNMGTILRTARAAGVQAVLLAPGTMDAFAPKVVRSAMGAHFHLPIHALKWSELQNLLGAGGAPRPRIYLADVREGADYSQADYRRPTALLLGGEAQGAGSEAQRLADERVHIPMPGQSESLNVAVAAAILMFEVVRQRKIDPHESTKI